MTVKAILTLIVCAQLLVCVAISQAQSGLIGSWKVEITFGNGARHSLDFKAAESGKGSFLLNVPKPKLNGSTEPLPAEWSESDGHSVTVSGPMQFPLGNIAFERGTLVLMGKLGTSGSITGRALFFPANQDPKDPKARSSKSGTFKAVRVAL